MPTDLFTCPYCNAYLSGPSEAGQRLTCPRCGERMLLHTREAALQAVIPSPGGSGQAEGHPAPLACAACSPDVPTPRRFSNRAVVLTILAVMVTMALVSLSLSLETVAFRRANDARIVKPHFVAIPLILKVASSVWMVGLVLLLLGFWRKQETANEPAAGRTRWLYGAAVSLAVLSTMMILFAGPIRRRSSQTPVDLGPLLPRSLKPAELEAWRYVPADSDVVLGVHVHALVDDPPSRDFLDGLKIAALPFSAERLRQWTGIDRDDLDYLVLGLKVEDHLKPRVTLVFRSRIPFTAEELRGGLHGTLLSAGDPTRFHYKIADTALEADAWCVPAEQLVIVGLTRGDREAWAALPHEGLERLPPRLHTALRLRLRPGARIWAVCQVDDWQRTPLAWWLAQQPEKDREALKTIRSFAAWLRFEPRPVLSAEVEAADVDAARTIAAFLHARAKDDPDVDVKTAEKDRWLSIQARLAAKAMQSLFGTGL